MDWQQGNFQKYVSAVDMRCDLPGRTILPVGTEFQYDGYKVVIDGTDATIAPPSFRSAVGRGWLRLASGGAVIATSAPLKVATSFEGLSEEAQGIAAAIQEQFPGAFSTETSAPDARPSFESRPLKSRSGAPPAIVGRADVEDQSVQIGRPGDTETAGVSVTSTAIETAVEGGRFPLTHEAPVGVVGQPVTPTAPVRKAFPLVSNESDATRVFPLNNVTPAMSRAAVAARGEAVISPVKTASGDNNLKFNPGALVREAGMNVGPATKPATPLKLKPEVAAVRNQRKLEVAQEKYLGFTWDFALPLEEKVQAALGNLQWLSAIFEVEEAETKEAIQQALGKLQQG